MILLDCAQGSPEWFAARLGIPTASCFADILTGGKTRESYLEKLVRERLTAKPSAGFTSRQTEQGTEREPKAVAVYEVRKGVFVDRVGFCRHDTIEAGASPDFLVGEEGAGEVKCPDPAAHHEYLKLPDGTAPKAYLPQVQGVLWICGRKWCDFVSWNPDFRTGLDLVVRRVLRDQAYIDKLSGEVRVFAAEVAERVAALEALQARA